MYMDALEFLEDERESWRPFEALAELSDDALEAPMPNESPAHGWSGRDLAGHMLAWREYALTVARELAIGEASPTMVRVDREWEELGADVVNARLHAEWSALPLEELRRRLASIPGELRGYLTVVPEARWVKNSGAQQTFRESTMDHDDDHRADLAAILAAARERGT